ncbi:hypothetical protein JIG36_00335 [Actinoplanes sp. LDG1-06]|uniref:Uncharacterized protein n=1 Tax=Paractinoplanes ovalisporus TaxID=2810368 RepID=A0ABS2A2D0_9ACTN|nr:hypothetical protein [Actinoplanes ovalisporus]MBM2614002.1 hypothetical protein [Actinoplanes ovalisporus]
MTRPVEPIRRTQYWDYSFGTVRGAPTADGESWVDAESYDQPITRASASSFHEWGVGTGLEVTAVQGQPGLTVAAGSALDGAGNLIVLADKSRAIVDPNAPTGVLNVPTVAVTANGVTLDTAGLTGDVVVALGWREVQDDTQPDAPVLLHAPQLTLVPGAYPADGTTVPLARATLAAGQVTALTAGPRRVAVDRAGRLTLTRPRASGLTVGQTVAAELAVNAPDGRLDVIVGGSPALSVQPATGNVGVGVPAPRARLHVEQDTPDAAGLRVSSSGAAWGSGLQLANHSGGGRTYGTYAGSDGRWHFADVDDNVDRLVVDQAGNVGIGADGPLARTLHVEGSEIHSGGGGAGFSFADRGQDTFVDIPGAGERWVWYSHGGTASLWSGRDLLSVRPDGSVDLGGDSRSPLRVHGDAIVGSTGNGVLTVRHVDGKNQANDTKDDLYLNWSTGRGVHVGGGNPAGLFVHGPATVDTDLQVQGQLRAPNGLAINNGGTIASGGRMHIAGEELLYLLNRSGVIVSSAWGGNGNLTVEGKQLNVFDRRVPDWSAGGVAAPDLFAGLAIYVGNPAGASIQMLAEGGSIAAGRISAPRKSFVIDHPLDPENRDLVHGCLEGPELAVYYRGEAQLADGVAHIRLPSYFEALTSGGGRTVQLTAVSELDEPVSMLAATPVCDGGFSVRAADPHNPAQRFCWEVKAVRADVEPLIVEEAKTRTPAFAG